MKFINHKKLGFVFFCLMFSSCIVLRAIKYGGIPAQDDYKHFTQRKINNSNHHFDFFAPTKDYQLGTKIGLTDKDFNSTNISLDGFVNLHKTVGFMIIRNDTILYEKYRRKYSDSSLISSFSMVKPIVSSLIGIAIGEGRIHGIEDFASSYLPMLANNESLRQITIKQLLHHTSGLKFSDRLINPASDNSKYYWGTHLRKEMGSVKIEVNPDSVFHYSSVNTLLLAAILEKVTGMSVSQYLEEKIWKPLGMESPAFWSLDRNDELAIEKAFCCLQATARDFAKFGRLYLKQGMWDGHQIIPTSWVTYSTRSDPSGHNKHFYNNNWGIGPLKYGSFFAVGLYGQYIYVYPEKNILILRFGDADLNYHPNYWNSVFLQIIDQL